MERIAYAFPIARGQEDDVRAVAASLRDAAEEFGRTREELGLTALGVWLQPTAQGHLVVLLLEGELKSYFEAVSKDPGIDSWFRDKIVEWTGSIAEASAVYEYPQSEELFNWSSDSQGGLPDGSDEKSEGSLGR